MKKSPIMTGIKATLAASVLGSSLYAGGTSETIVYVDSDLVKAKEYKSIRYNVGGAKTLYFDENYDTSTVTYAKPDNFSWKKMTVESERYLALQFPDTASYAVLYDVAVKDNLYLGDTEEGEKYFVIDGGRCMGQNCLEDENIVSAVIPKRYKITSYESWAMPHYNAEYQYQPDTRFVVVNNTVTMYSKNKSGSYMKLWLMDTSTSADIYKATSNSMQQYKEIGVTQQDQEIKINLPVDNLFDSGSANTKAIGKEWLTQLATSLKGQRYKKIRVEGHSDGIPIKSSKFPSNWELSAGRAADAVRVLIDGGVPSNMLEAVGYADTKPVAKNDTAENRAKNRRIEITIVAVDDSSK